VGIDLVQMLSFTAIATSSRSKGFPSLGTETGSAIYVRALMPEFFKLVSVYLRGFLLCVELDRKVRKRARQPRDVPATPKLPICMDKVAGYLTLFVRSL
jgi:hypothetical protein